MPPIIPIKAVTKIIKRMYILSSRANNKVGIKIEMIIMTPPIVGVPFFSF